MKKNKKLLIACILIIIFALCFIPPKNNNSKYRLNISSIYGDTESYHPKILSFKNGWNGYKYWLSFTPYPKGDDSKENPHIAVSNDLINWKTINGNLDDISNDGIKEQYNSDSHIVYNYNSNELECYWRFVDDINNKVIIYRRKTKDGINWSTKEETAISYDRKSKDYISPAIIYENDMYTMWYVDFDNQVMKAISVDGKNWTDKNEININYEKKLSTWHLDVIHTVNGYEMLVVAYDKWANRNNMNLYYSKSVDGIAWDDAKVIMEPTKTTNNWDNKGIYRSSFIYEDGQYYVFYGGTDKSYHHGIGFVYGNDIFNLNSVKTNYKNKNEVNELINKINNK